MKYYKQYKIKYKIIYNILRTSKDCIIQSKPEVIKIRNLCYFSSNILYHRIKPFNFEKGNDDYEQLLHQQYKIRGNKI